MGDPRRGSLTEIVLLEGRVLDVRHPPVQGSGYECAALELAHLRPLPPQPRPVVVREPPQEQMLEWLTRVAGSEEALDALDGRPLPTGEALDLSGVPERLHERLRRIDERLVLAGGHVILGPELLTACRRLLVRAVESGHVQHWRTQAPEQVAATVVHCSAKANALIGTSAPFRVTQVLEQIGVRGTPGARSRSLAEALGGSSWPHGRRPQEAPDVFVVGDPALLLGRFRRELVIYRDVARTLAARTEGAATDTA